MQFGANNTPFSREEFAFRLACTKQRMAAAGLDALYVSEPANLNYLTGYDGWSFYVHQGVLVDETVLEPNMTIHFMPGLWLDDWGIAISESIRITETGVEAFCDFPRRLFIK
ncbi:hypothetical protein ATER59S_04593 [Aquamicrobium terrae]